MYPVPGDHQYDIRLENSVWGRCIIDVARDVGKQLLDPGWATVFAVGIVEHSWVPAHGIELSQQRRHERCVFLHSKFDVVLDHHRLVTVNIALVGHLEI